jgi:hypothetical protein
VLEDTLARVLKLHIHSLCLSLIDVFPSLAVSSDIQLESKRANSEKPTRQSPFKSPVGGLSYIE